ncbi:tyrosine-type recombinase/integrase [Sphingomonas sp. HMP6]|uniref:tyrosine-type recombinase/integrase n=1 Tax=Sphingomonas sp. HMP6 TaxID=1517551 RepID=UPI001596B79B|nr:tyrosine-type recombinase/integrase [Sphingomonas sp. HMP6]BCA59515.1 hypothetical protein HMP06_2284 [Sphingomonas sp. HMP6]
MNALSLKAVVAGALADVGVDETTFPPTRGRPRDTVWFTMESGFGLRRYASGRNVYIVQSRMNGRVRTVTIGPASVLTQAMAASVAKRVIAHALVGNDPAEDRKRIRNAPAFDDFVKEYWEKCESSWKPSTRRSWGHYRRMLIDGAFPDRYIDDIMPGDIARWFARATDSSGPGGANACVDILRTMFNKAEQWGYRIENTNPCTGQRKNRARRFERYLTPEQMADVGKVLIADRDGADRLKSSCATAMLLLLLTGCRHSEILNLKWPDINGQRIRLSDAKKGRRTVWLGSEARAMIDAIPRHNKIDCLFWNYSYRRQIKCVGSYWKTVQARVGLSGLRVHDTRHTFASHAVQRAETIPMVGRLLGHAKISSTLRYAHLDDAHALAASQQIADAIEKMMDSGEAPDYPTAKYDALDWSHGQPAE